MTRLPRQAGARLQVAIAIPTRQQIADAVSNLPAAMQQPYRYNSGPRTFLTIGAGMVQISRREPGSADAARERAHLRRIREVDAVVQAEYSGLNDPMAFYDSLDEVRARLGEYSDAERPTRGKIRGWSAQSRTRMKRTLDTLDYSPLFDDDTLEPAMVTLTMPGAGWEDLVPTPRDFKRKVYSFKESFRRAWGRPLVGVWKLEFQRRGAPHLHVLMTPPAGQARGEIRGTFREWLGPAWAHVVGHPDPIEYAKHERAGTGIDYVGAQYRDPRRIATYFGKHGLFEAKGYQNDMPQLWRDAIDEGAPGAGFWGRWGLEKAEATVELNELQPVGGGRNEHYRRCYAEEVMPWATDRSVGREAARRAHGSAQADAVTIERHLRKLSRSLAATRHNGQIVQKLNKRGQLVSDMHIRVLRSKQLGYDETSGVVTGERMRKRYVVGYYQGGGGFLSVNDGRVSAATIHRLLDARTRWDIAA